MSTVKAVNFQVGQSLTASQNFSWYQPSSPDGTVRLGVGNAGATTSDVVTVNSSGNLGLGVTPSGWSLIKSFQIAGGVSLGGYNNNLYLNANAYYDGSWKYVANGYATRIQSDTGSFSWFTAPSGTAGNAISFTQAMTLNASGNLLVGTTSAVGVSRIQAYLSTAQNINGMAVIAAAASGGGSAPAFEYYNSSNARKAVTYLDQANTRFYVVCNEANGVYLASGGTAWTSASDERLKTDLKPIKNAAEKVTSLRAVTGRFKTDDAGVSRSFLIAQDVLAVLPEAVDTSDPDKLGVQYTDMIPLLVAAIKELSAQVTTLQAEINALKA